MFFTADLHIHSRFSRATSKKLNPYSLAAWAMLKGVHVLGTGDFTHPAWQQELRDTLEPDESCGLYRLKDQENLLQRLAGELPEQLAGALPAIAENRRPPHFMLQTEISSIYKRGGKVRKVHNIVYMPDLDAVERFSRRLSAIGNLAADGRPILGLDSHDLLEIVLEISPEAVLVPAHAWTPWFAVFGSKSGFDSMEECFGDLTPHIFALETGLSSDPPMNRLWSHLDGYALISNSDAHSGENLARELNIFQGTPSYAGIFASLRTAARREPQTDPGCRFQGTIEFFPEEGKYHLDGHRNCNVVLEPQEALKLGNLCPVCGKPLTIGVLHRVRELADRQEPPAGLLHEPPHVSLVPLPELLGEICGTGSKSQKVALQYNRILRELGPEMDILRTIGTKEISRFWEPLGEGIARMRRGEVNLHAGYDGEYGTVRVFTRQEVASFSRSGSAGRTLLLPLSVPAAPEQSPAADREQKAATADALLQSRTADGKQKSATADALTHSREAAAPVPWSATADAKPQCTAGPAAATTADTPADISETTALQKNDARLKLLPEKGPEHLKSGVCNTLPTVPAETSAQLPAAVASSVSVSSPAEAAKPVHAGSGLLAETVRGSENVVPGNDRSTGFSGAQWRAVTAGPEPVLVLAGPGAGKTRVLIGRVAHLLQLGTRPSDILAVTFTCRAAAEIQTRLLAEAASVSMEAGSESACKAGGLTGSPQKIADSAARNMAESPAATGGTRLPWCDTLHALARRVLLRADPESQCRVIDERGALGLFTEAVHSRLPDCGKKEVRELWQTYSLCREKLSPLPEPLPAIDLAYRAAKRRSGAQDYTDLPERWLELLRAGNPRLPRWKHILVDEIQDLSPLQSALLRKICPDDGRGFFGIGDPDQAIYGFRGADADVLNTFRRAWPAPVTLSLQESYRATPQILACATALMHGNPQCGVLVSRRGGNGSVHYCTAPDGQAELFHIARQIKRLIGRTSHTLQDQDERARQRKMEALALRLPRPGSSAPAGAPRQSGTPSAIPAAGQPCISPSAAQHEAALSLIEGSLAPGDIAILVRLNAQIPHIGEILHKEGIPWTSAPENPLCLDPDVALLAQAAARALGLEAELAPLLAKGMPLMLPDNFPPETGVADTAAQDRRAAGSPHAAFSLETGVADTAAPDSLTTPSPELPASRSPLQLSLLPVTAGEWRQGPQVVLSRHPGLTDSFFPASPAGKRLFRLWEKEPDWGALLAALLRIHEDELLQEKTEHVRVMTMHAAKGLEFRAVFIPALEDGLIPLRRRLTESGTGGTAPGGISTDSPEKNASAAPPVRAENSSPVSPDESPEEARRLLFVAATRASDLLFLSRALRRQFYHQEVRLPPSPFLKDLAGTVSQSILQSGIRKKSTQFPLL